MSDPKVGQKVRVTYERERPSNDPEKGWVTSEGEDIGTIVAVPSRKFDFLSTEFDFDYSLGEDMATRSVNLDGDVMCQLHYNAGGDADWSKFRLVKVEFL